MVFNPHAMSLDMLKRCSGHLSNERSVDLPTFAFLGVAFLTFLDNLQMTSRFLQWEDAGVIHALFTRHSHLMTATLADIRFRK